MLQPSQLEDVSVRYADEIAELHEFFTTAGIAVENPQALAQVVRRLGEDRRFHRDLTSHVWVMLHRRGNAVRYGETLGVLALAASGKQLAADADESVAHDLLRFVMEAHDGLNPPARSTDLPLPVIASMESTAPVQNINVVVEKPDAPVADSAKSSVIMQLPAVLREPMPVEAGPLAPVENVEIPPARPVLDTPIRFSRVDVETAPRSKPLMWVGLAALFVLAALVGGWFYRNTSAAPEAVATPAPVIDGNAASAPTSEAPTVKQDVSGTPVVTPAPNVVSKSSVAPTNSHARVAASLHRQPVPARQMHVVPSPARVAPAVPQQVASVAPPPAAVSRPAAAPAPIVRSSATPQKSTAPATVSAGILSKQLDRPGLTPEQEAEYDATGRRYPHLLRRTPLNNSDTLMAKANVVPSFNGANTAVASTSAGTVRPTSLGVMASNLIYSPAAAYPQAASAAHVEGAVKVEAVVDKSGNVAAARVISGPPQLRDAALNAVQQWRYKPYVLGGKPRQFTTQALMEFELQ